MKKVIVLVAFLVAITVNSQKLHFKYEKDSLKQVESISKLAKAVLKVYKNENRDTYLDNIFRVQIAANLYQESMENLDSLRLFYKKNYGSFVDVIGVQFESYLKTVIKKIKSMPLLKISMSQFLEIFMLI
jgi:type I site-specific restriction endonuclease